MERTARRLGRRDQRVRGCRVAQVGRADGGALAQLRREGREGILARPGEGNPRALAVECARDGGTDAARGARDERRPAVKPEHAFP